MKIENMLTSFLRFLFTKIYVQNFQFAILTLLIFVEEIVKRKKCVGSVGDRCN